MTQPSPQPTPPLLGQLDQLERLFFIAVATAFPDSSAIGAAQATGIRDSGLALGRAQILLQRPALIQAIRITMGQDTVASLCQQVGLEPPATPPSRPVLAVDGTDIADARARKVFWSDLMADPEVSPGDRLRASDLLAKAEGDYKGDEKPTQECDLTAMLERLDAQDHIWRKAENLRKTALVQAGAVPAGVNLATLSDQLHTEWFKADGSIRTDRARRRVVIETIPANQVQPGEPPDGTDALGSVDQQDRQEGAPVPSLTHHMKKSRPNPGATLAEAYRLPESTF